MLNGAAGLTVGDPVLRTGNPLSVELGPGKIDISNGWHAEQSSIFFDSSGLMHCLSS